MITHLLTRPHLDAPTIDRAYRLAHQHHEGQLRRSGDPYITHPVEVATIVADAGGDTTLVCAALLHDCPPGTTSDPDVTAILTGLQRLSDGVPERPQPDVLLLKLADRLHNMRTIEHVLPGTQREKSVETLRALVPLAYRLGVRDIASELSLLARAALRRAERAPWVLRGVGMVLPAGERERWVAEWAGEMAVLGWWGRCRFVAALVIGLPRLLVALRS